ncbi:MAG TPA: hypothetical protein VJA19_07380 [Pseudomonas sp.]|nr:hypothetical protein [Pseudomonas sp.]
MKTDTADSPNTQAPQPHELLPAQVLLAQPGTPARVQQDDWRLSRSARSLRSWRLSK